MSKSYYDEIDSGQQINSALFFQFRTTAIKAQIIELREDQEPYGSINCMQTEQPEFSKNRKLTSAIL